MEQVLLSSPGGHSDWDLDLKPPLGFLLLNPDEQGGLPSDGKESSESHLDFQDEKKDLMSFSLDEILQENALNLLQDSGYSSVEQILSWEKGTDCPVHEWKDNSLPCQKVLYSRPVESTDFAVSNESSCTNIFSFVGDVGGNDFSVPGLALERDSRADWINVDNSPDEVIDLNDSFYHEQASAETSDCKPESLSQLDFQLLSGFVSSPCEVSQHGANEELPIPQCKENGITPALPDASGVSSSLIEMQTDLLFNNSIPQISPEYYTRDSSCVTDLPFSTKPQVIAESFELQPGELKLNTNGTVGETELLHDLSSEVFPNAFVFDDSAVTKHCTLLNGLDSETQEPAVGSLLLHNALHTKKHKEVSEILCSGSGFDSEEVKQCSILIFNSIDSEVQVIDQRCKSLHTQPDYHAKDDDDVSELPNEVGSVKHGDETKSEFLLSRPCSDTLEIEENSMFLQSKTESHIQEAEKGDESLPNGSDKRKADESCEVLPSTVQLYSLEVEQSYVHFLNSESNGSIELDTGITEAYETCESLFNKPESDVQEKSEIFPTTHESARQDTGDGTRRIVFNNQEVNEGFQLLTNDGIQLLEDKFELRPGKLDFESLGTREKKCLEPPFAHTEQHISDNLSIPVGCRECGSSSYWLQPQSSELQVSSRCIAGDAVLEDDPLRGHHQSFSQDLMADRAVVDLPDQPDASRDLMLDINLSLHSTHNNDNNDSLLPEGAQHEMLTSLEAEGINGCPRVEISADASYEKQTSRDDSGWFTSSLDSLRTSEQDIQRLALPEVGASPSLPMRSSGAQSEEDLSSLKVVFDALDQDSDGFVRIEEFVQFATAYGAEQVKDLTRFLDPSGLGVISFEDFYRGITAISSGGESSEPQLYVTGFGQEDDNRGCSEEYEDCAVFEQNEVTDSAYLGSESTYSECETFTDEDTGAMVHPELHEEGETDSAIGGALHDNEDTGSRLSLGSELNSHSLVTVIGGEEEHFEDFGESNDSELLQETLDGLEDESMHASQAHSSTLLLSPSAAPFPASFQSFLREEVLDFFCSQCHKQISRLEDLSTRLNFLEMNSTSKRLSSKKVARHLLQTSNITLDSMDDLSRDILEMADTDITDKVMLLEKRVSELEKDSTATGEQLCRLRQENLQLVHRAHALEEQLKEQEARAEEALLLEVRRQKEAIGKLERERGMELENLQSRLQQLDEENSELRSCVPCLRANIERLEEEKRKLQDEVEHVSDRLNEELEARRKLSDKLSHESYKHQKEKECTQELIEDLRKQLEHLQLYKLEVEAKSGRSPSAGLQEYQSRTREAELEQEIRRLKQDNRSLKEQNDELNGQIINLSIQGAKNLFSASFSESLAAEINSVSRDELMEAIHKQEEINYRLQDYIDRIIVAIMESNPSILEVK